MTVRAQPVALGTTPKPHPPLQSRHYYHHPGVGMKCAATDKHFTVRDGFHLKSRNDEKKLAIDQQLLPQSKPPLSAAEAGQSDAHTHEDDSVVNDTQGPNAQEIPLALHLKLLEKHEKLESRVDNASNNSNAEDDGTLAQQFSVPASKPATATPLSPASTLWSSHNSVEAKAIAARIEPSSEWLIYRQRADLTPRRHDQRVEEMIQRVLQPQSSSSDLRPQLIAPVIATTRKESELLLPTRPRQPSLSGSTYHQRVLATRQKNSKARALHPLGELAPLTETERLLVSSREEKNRDVDRLLVTLFQQQQQSASSGKPELSESLSKRPTELKFSTRRSVFREQTAAALKSRNLVSRMDELRSLPQVLEQMVQKHRDKQQQLVLTHGENLILKNKRQPCLNLLQRPPQTPVFPSSIEQKQQQAIRRKEVFDAKEEAAVRSAVDRWQTRRHQRQEEARRTHRQCQWLLLTTLAQTSVNWLGKFQEWKLKRDALRQVVMARRIQAFWRECALIRRNSLSGFGCFASAPISSPFYRMPIVMKAISLMQKAMRQWLTRKKNKHNVVAIEIIVTSWLEFQDVKFRRLILRFRKRVRDFQIMWRTWRAITEARIKLLLHVWAKLERKSKRRHGILNSNNYKPLGIPDSGSALVHSLKATTAVVSPEKHQKQLEGMHRHLKNGGTIQTPLSIASVAAGSASSSSGKSSSIATIARVLSPGFSVSLRAKKASGRVKQDLEFRQQMGEEFQHAMQDFYATNSSNHHGDPGNPHLYSSPSHMMMMAPHASLRSANHSRGDKGVSSSSSSSSPSWRTIVDAVAPPTHAEKVPLQLKVAMLRHLLSEKRKAFQLTKDKKREEWKSKRQQMRRVEFRYNVLEELVAYQRFQAENSVFLLLHHVSEAEMLHVMHRAQQAANAAAAVTAKQERPGSGFFAHAHHSEGPRNPQNLAAHVVLASDSTPPQEPPALAICAQRRSTTVGYLLKSSSLVSAGNSVVELLEDDE